ncbi:MAG: hypothetical protein WAL56_20640 [Candidatus Sulfotelmatobacter sp.]
MYKNLLIALLLIAFAPVAAHSADPASPVIVAKRRLVNQTAPIPTTTIFTPAHDGVYRLSAYATITQSDPSSQSYWIWNPTWTDDAGPANCNGQCYIGAGDTPGQFQLQLGLQLGVVMTIEAKAGTPISYNVYQQGSPDASVYSLYYVLEKIE